MRRLTLLLLLTALCALTCNASFSSLASNASGHDGSDDEDANWLDLEEMPIPGGSENDSESAVDGSAAAAGHYDDDPPSDDPPSDSPSVFDSPKTHYEIIDLITPPRAPLLLDSSSSSPLAASGLAAALAASPKAVQVAKDEDPAAHASACPGCRSGSLRICRRGKDDKEFFGCTNYPVCRYSESKMPDEKATAVEADTQCWHLSKRRKNADGSLVEYQKCPNKDCPARRTRIMTPEGKLIKQTMRNEHNHQSLLVVASRQ